MRRRERPDLAPYLDGLKDFQHRTAEYAFRRLYVDDDATDRFLVADEVGLGKTLVARGVVAKAIDHLWDKVRRIDIVYICSNADIARQNINRLEVRVAEQGEALFASRLTMLPTKVANLKRNPVNFVSFTPGTSFDLRSSLGRAEERALLYWLLKDAWDLRGTGPLNVLRGSAAAANFRSLVARFQRDYPIDRSLASAYQRILRKHKGLRGRFQELCRLFHRVRKRIPSDQSRERARVVGELRWLLAATCIEALEPDLIILDEFQRFKHLLRPDGEAGQLANELFNYADKHSRARVLLLSATPYKMYTLSHESAEEDHYSDFLDTLGFLFRDADRTHELQALLGRYRRELYRLGEDRARAADRLRALKRDLQRRLSSVMARTERLAVTDDRNGMLRQVIPDSVRLKQRDLESYLALQRVAGLLGHGDVLEYWKASPYLLNFMEDYKLKYALKSALKRTEGRAALAPILDSGGGVLMPWEAWQTYSLVDPGNARLRSLVESTVECGAWQLLWMPPSLPYYLPEGPFARPELQGFTKRLIFSGWTVVPKTVASLVSYEAERRMIRLMENDPDHPPENSPDARSRRRPLLRFAVEADGRPVGMPVLGMLYPSPTLAGAGDPLAIAREIVSERGGAGGPPALSDVLTTAEGRMRELLALIGPGHDKSEAPIDESWYWAAPVVLDAMRDGDAARDWFRRDLARRWSGWEAQGADEDEGGESRWADHVDEARKVLLGETELGAFPDDLAEVLAVMAVAAPGVVALRSLSRVCGLAASKEAGHAVRDQAARAAWAFRTLFNQPEVMALLRGTDTKEQPYWRRVLEYCAQGGLQAVLDEYAHVLHEYLGLAGKDMERVAEGIAGGMRDALSLRTANLFADDIRSRVRGAETPKRYGMRGRFALRFGDSRSEDGRTLARSSQVRDAFNSPFWPFVLVTTSVGQEGLDFHSYCHVVVHWDLPSNPVDLEQREGRVHRYKGHAVRRNVARRHAAAALAPAAGDEDHGSDPWSHLFLRASGERPPGSSDLVPFWLYPLPGGALIERHVPALPLSRDLDRLAALRRSLAVYRMVFGQPRQEDLLAYLMERLPAREVSRIADELRVDLGPPAADLNRGKQGTVERRHGRANRRSAELRGPDSGEARRRAPESQPEAVTEPACSGLGRSRACPIGNPSER